MGERAEGMSVEVRHFCGDTDEVGPQLSTGALSKQYPKGTKTCSTSIGQMQWASFGIGYCCVSRAEFTAGSANINGRR